MKHSVRRTLDMMREEVRQCIDAKYRTVEEFCWDKGLNKATISNFLNNKKDFQISTLETIARACGKKLKILLE